ncbi:MAG: GAF and ANTAR domain-containing protein [Nonomuraea sp.]|nr:GAF and ANTAR domain-containing protein [Nonomuraea sp.]
MNRTAVPAGIDEFERALAETVVAAAAAMPDSPLVSVALCTEQSIRSAACSHSRAEDLDRLQSASRQGPSFDAIETGRPVTAADLDADSRWRLFTAGSPGVRSLHAEPVVSDGQVLGTLNLYSGSAGGFSAQTHLAARLSAGHIGVLFGVALDAARLREVAAQLKEALNTRAIIDQALGIVMARRRCGSQQAFELLRQVSQDRNVKVHQVAAMIVETVSGHPPQRPSFEDPPL